MKHNKKSSRKGSAKKGRVITSRQLEGMIIRLLAMHSNQNYTIKQIKSKLKIDNSLDAISHAIDRLETKGAIRISSDQRITWNSDSNYEDVEPLLTNAIIEGRVDMTRNGSAYVITEHMDDDVYIPAKHTDTAMNRDMVKVLMAPKRGGRRPEGRIIEVVKRAVTHVIGTVRVFDQYSVVYPLLEGNYPEIGVKNEYLNKAKDGQAVLVEITSWGKSQNKSLWGKVDKVLKHLDKNDLAMQSILLNSGFQLEFPKEVLKESEAIDGAITDAEIARRRDMREVLTFTIDPETAKDFDDAISYRVVEEDQLEIGVHIADVSHYLKEGSALDKEALERSTSVYLVDRVVPMLPERLSNDLCSLNPHEDKLTFSAVFTFDSKYKIINEWFGKTIIHSDRRFTYEEAQLCIETGEGDYVEELLKVNSLTSHMRKKRFKNGAINFESDEVRFILDADNKPVGVYTKERKDAHLLIEELMLQANKSVATYLAKKAKPEIPNVYRIHDLPDLERLADFALFAKELGFPMKLDRPDKISATLNNLTKASMKDESLKMLLPLAIRTMAKAEYSTVNIGHYGLAFDYYSHFTSPIRRYSDVLTHRILFENLGDEHVRRDKELLETKCKHISKQERKAMDAERDSIKYKQVEYMEDKIGQIFHGVISGMIEKGIFVEVVESKAEGLIPFKKLGGDYQIDNARLRAVNKRTGEELKMGSRVLIRLDDADLDRRLLEFTIVEG